MLGVDFRLRLHTGRGNFTKDDPKGKPKRRQESTKNRKRFRHKAHTNKREKSAGVLADEVYARERDPR